MASLLANLLLLINSCASGPTRAPLTGALYMGDSANQGLYSKKGDPEVKCSDPQFDGMVCLNYDDFVNAVSCK